MAIIMRRMQSQQLIQRGAPQDPPLPNIAKYIYLLIPIVKLVYMYNNFSLVYVVLEAVSEVVNFEFFLGGGHTPRFP